MFGRLRRNDLVKRALSEIQHRMQAAAKETPCEASISAIAQDCRNQLIGFSWLKTLFLRHQFLQISYEELVGDQHGKLDEICRFLGVSEGRVKLPERNRTADLISGSRSSSILGRLWSSTTSKATSKPDQFPYPYVSNAAFILGHQALAEYRDFVPWG